MIILYKRSRYVRIKTILIKMYSSTFIEHIFVFMIAPIYDCMIVPKFMYMSRELQNIVMKSAKPDGQA